MFSGRLSVRPSVCPSVVRPLTHISRDATSLYLAKGFQWNLPQIFIMWAEIAEKVFEVGGQKSRSYVYDVWMLYRRSDTFRPCNVEAHMFACLYSIPFALIKTCFVYLHVFRRAPVGVVRDHHHYHHYHHHPRISSRRESWTKLQSRCVSRLTLMSMLLWPIVCVAVWSAEQFRLQCTLECPHGSDDVE